MLISAFGVTFWITLSRKTLHQQPKWHRILQFTLGECDINIFFAEILSWIISSFSVILYYLQFILIHFSNRHRVVIVEWWTVRYYFNAFHRSICSYVHSAGTLHISFITIRNGTIGNIDHIRSNTMLCRISLPIGHHKETRNPLTWMICLKFSLWFQNLIWHSNLTGY